MKELFRRLWSLWFGFWLVSYFLVLLPVYGLVLWRVTPARARLAHRLNKWWGRFILFLGRIRVRVPLGYVLPERPCLLVANHRSYLDIPICYAILPPRVVFVGKAELARIPLFGWMYRRLHIVLRRDSLRDRVHTLRAVRTKLQAGFHVLIYPEGTTRHARPLGPFHEGAFALAVELGVPLVPFVIIGSDLCLSADGRFLMQPGEVHCYFHPPIDPAGHTVQTLKEAVYKWMHETLVAYEHNRVLTGQPV
ncbi:MAG: lysophospholipid acyltransferase family protein [Bacteroidia bacterium]